MAKIFPIDFEEKNTIAQDDYILFSDSEDGDKIKKAQYSNLKGEKGDTGTAATVTVGSTTTGAAGTCACVTNSGTTSAAVLNFTIPKGDKGDTGQTGPAIVCAEWNGNDIDFTEEDGNVVKLDDAKLCLKGDKGDTGPQGPSGTITIGTTTTLDPGCSATVSNSGTCCAAVFNFGIPKGDKGDTGAAGAAATIAVGTTTTVDAGCCASVTNAGTSSAAVFNFEIPKGDKGDEGPQGCTGATGNGIACVTSSKTGKVTTVDITCTNGCSYCFAVCDGEDGQGAGDVIGPASSTDGDVVLFDGNSGKLIKDSGKTLPGVCDSLSCGSTTDALSAKQGCVLSACVTAINQKIPSAATCSNQLADKNYVDDSINSVTAYYITKNAAGDQFATYAELAAATTFYSGGVVRVPTKNDYTIVLDDENHNDEVTRYIYNSGWEYQYSINESPMTQAQLDALNSGITAAKVSGYDSIPVITDNCQLSNGCGYTTCTGTLSSCADVISALGYTPYNSSNPSGYTTCTGTVVAADLTVVSGDSGTTYTIKKASTAPGSATNTTITFVV